MRVRLPLYAKILLWFFLNVVLLAAVFAFLFNAQFSFNLDWFLAGGAQARIEAVRKVIVDELDNTPPQGWQQVLDRYSEAYNVRFSLVDDEARYMIGDTVEMPKEVRDRITSRHFPRWHGPPPTSHTSNVANTTDATPVPTPRPTDRQFRGWRPPFRAVMRTKDPTQYWLMANARIDNPQAGDPMAVVLIARSRSISGGGLIFDPRPWLWLGIGAVVFSLLFWLPLVRGITRFIYQTTQATRRIAGGRFDVRVKGRRLDELGELGEAINQMAGHLDNLVTGQKRFLGDIAHELCSPLAHLQMTLAILEQHAQGPAEEKYVRSAVAKASQIATLVNELLSFSKASFGASSVQLHPVRLREAVNEALRNESCESSRVQIAMEEDLAVAADRDLLVRAIANLIRNAVRHAGSAEVIEISAIREGKEIALTVADSGPGVPEGDISRIFDAFYRVDSSRTRETGGAGLGLTIVKTCVESCCGSVEARNREPHGLAVIIRLRSADSDATEPASPEPAKTEENAAATH